MRKSVLEVVWELLKRLPAAPRADGGLEAQTPVGELALEDERGRRACHWTDSKTTASGGADETLEDVDDPLEGLEASLDGVEELVRERTSLQLLEAPEAESEAVEVPRRDAAVDGAEADLQEQGEGAET